DRSAFAASLQPLISGQLPELCREAVAQAARETDLSVLLGTSSLASVLLRLTRVVPPDPQGLPELVDLFPTRSNLMLGPLVAALRGWRRSRRRSRCTAPWRRPTPPPTSRT